MVNLIVRSVTVSASSKRFVDTPKGTQDNFVSMHVEKEDGTPFTPEEAAQAKIHTTLALQRLLLMDDLSQGLITLEMYQERKARIDHCYTKLLTGDGKSFWKPTKEPTDDS